MIWKRSLKVAFFWLLACNLLALAGIYFFRHLPIRIDSWHRDWTHFHWQLKFWMICGLPFAWTLPKDFWSEEDNWSLSRLGFLCGFGLGPWIAGAFELDQGLAFFPPFLGLSLVSAVLNWPRRDLRPAFRALCLFNVLAFLNGIFSFAPLWGMLVLPASLALGLSPSGIRGGAFALLAVALGVVVKLQIAWEGWRSALLLGVLIVSGWVLAMRREGKIAEKN